MDGYSSGLASNYAQTDNQYVNTGVNSTGYSNSVNQPGATYADVSQLQPGDVFQGEVVSVNGQDVQIQLTDGQYMAAKLERDVQIALGQFLNFEVQSNKDNKIVLRQSSAANSQLLRVGEAALRVANLAVNDKNLQLVSGMIENGMPIDKKTLMSINRLLLQHPEADAGSIMKMVKLNIPINATNISQFQNYQNLEHKLVDGIKDASNELLKVFDDITKNVDSTAQNTNNAISDKISSANEYMENVLEVLTEENSEKNVNIVDKNLNISSADGQIVARNENSGNEKEGIAVLNDNAIKTNSENKTQEFENSVNSKESNTSEKTDAKVLQAFAEGKDNAEKNVALNNHNDNVKNTITENNAQLKENVIKENSIKEDANDKIANKENGKENIIKNEAAENKIVDNLKQEFIKNTNIKGTSNELFPNKVVSLIKDGKLDLKDVKQLLSDENIANNITPEQKHKIFSSNAFKNLVKQGLQKQWSISPGELLKEDGLKDFYQKLSRQSSRLTQLMNDTGTANGESMRAMNNIKENVDFINNMNQMFNYVQLPLKLSGSQAHGDLYVYTNKKKFSQKGGTLTAFLHLDMDHLGSMDINISLQTEHNRVTTKFSLEEDVVKLIEEHIDELTKGLEAKGYTCKNIVEKQDKNKNKTVIENIEEQVTGRSTPLIYQTFDTRA